MVNIVNFPASIGLTQLTFKPVIRSKLNESMSGGKDKETTQFTKWIAQYQLGNMQERANGDYLTFMAELDRGAYFLAHSYRRHRPLEYLDGGALIDNASLGSFDGTGGVASITDSLNVNITGLPSGFKLTNGDFIEFKMSASTRSLHFIMDSVIASSTGAASVRLDHPLNLLHFNTSATINLEKPACLMGKFQSHEQSISPAFSTGSFSAEEVFE